MLRPRRGDEDEIFDARLEEEISMFVQSHWTDRRPAGRACGGEKVRYGGLASCFKWGKITQRTHSTRPKSKNLEKKKW